MKRAEWKRIILAACIMALTLPAASQQPRLEQRGQPGQPMMMPPQPEMAKKVTKLAALREMHRLGMTVEDVEKALSHVRALRDAEARLRAQTEQLLDQEIKALLAARPEDPPLPETAEAMRRLAEEYRRTEAQGWDALSRAIGPLKADGLRRLVTGPDRRQPDFVRPGEGVTRPPGVPEPIDQPDEGFGMIPPTPGAHLEQGQRQPQGPPPGGQRTLPDGPGVQGPGLAPQPGMQFQPLMQPRLTLAELTELLEQKLAAMKKSR
ncbi:MAG: hypothetical protein HRF45_05730 [Fimbriimonadia bacterium]